MKRGTLSNNLAIFYGVMDAFRRLLTIWMLYQFDFGQLTDATMTFFFFNELFFLGNVIIFSLLPAANV